MPALLVIEELDVPGNARLFEKAHHKRALVAVGKVIELAAQKMAGVDGDKIQECGLAFCVAEGFESENGIDIHRHNSRMCSIK